MQDAVQRTTTRFLPAGRRQAGSGIPDAPDRRRGIAFEVAKELARSNPETDDIRPPPCTARGSNNPAGAAGLLHRLRHDAHLLVKASGPVPPPTGEERGSSYGDGVAIRAGCRPGAALGRGYSDRTRSPSARGDVPWPNIQVFPPGIWSSMLGESPTTCPGGIMENRKSKYKCPKCRTRLLETWYIEMNEGVTLERRRIGRPFCPKGHIITYWNLAGQPIRAV